MPTPVYEYFGQEPTSVVMQTTDNFDGTTAQGSLPTAGQARWTFPAQSKGGAFNLQVDPIVVLGIHYSGAGTLTINKMIGGTTAVPVGTITAAGSFLSRIFLATDDTLELVSAASGATSGAPVLVEVVAIRATAAQSWGI